MSGYPCECLQVGLGVWVVLVTACLESISLTMSCFSEGNLATVWRLEWEFQDL